MKWPPLIDDGQLPRRIVLRDALATLAALPLQSEPLHLVSLPTIQATAPPAVPSPGGIPPTHVAPPVMAAQPAMTETPPAPASGIGQTQPPAPTLAPPPGAGTHVAPVPLPETHHAPPPAPTANVSIKAQDGDESSAFRARLTMDMVAEWRDCPALAGSVAAPAREVEGPGASALPPTPGDRPPVGHGWRVPSAAWYSRPKPAG